MEVGQLPQGQALQHQVGVPTHNYHTLQRHTHTRGLASRAGGRQAEDHPLPPPPFHTHKRLPALPRPCYTHLLRAAYVGVDPVHELDLSLPRCLAAADEEPHVAQPTVPLQLDPAVVDDRLRRALHERRAAQGTRREGRGGRREACIYGLCVSDEGATGTVTPSPPPGPRRHLSQTYLYVEWNLFPTHVHGIQ